MVSKSISRLCACIIGASQVIAGDAYATDLVRITNLSDVTIPQWITGDPAITQTMLVCVYHTTATTYAIKALGDGPGFMLKNGSYSIPYTISWNDGGASNPAGGTTALMTDSVKLSSRNNARLQTDVPTDSDDCNAGASPTAQLTVTISQLALDGAVDGTYSGVLTLVLSAS